MPKEKKDIASQVKEIVASEYKGFNQKTLRQFEEASQNFEKLVKSGLAKKKGRILATFEERIKLASKYTSNF